jgi:histidinol phosphatase-like enzyme
MKNKKIIYVDIDGTIAVNRDALRIANPSAEYEDTYPFHNRIQIINNLYDQGHTIVYWTARGASSGKDHTELTKKQLKEWGAKYHRLDIGNKPHFDMYICDKSYNSESWFYLNRLEGRE